MRAVHIGPPELPGPEFGISRFRGGGALSSGRPYEREKQMMIRIELSTAGLGRLEAFCAERLRDGPDPHETAFALMQGAGFGGGDPVRITVPADLCADGQEAELLFTDQRDFIWHDLDADPEP